MEENVGQALRQDSAQEQSFDTQNRITQPGSLMEEFSHVWDAVTDALPENGLDAIADNVENFLQQFERAEYSLGHALDNPDAIDKAFLSNSENVVSIFDHHNFQYSLKETSKEQDSATESGKELDENQVTELGRLKNGIQDTAHEDRNRKRTEEAARFVNMMSAHEQYIADLEARLNDLRDKAALLREQYDALENADALLAEGDINEDSPNGTSRRKELRTQLKAAGMDLDDFELPNGQIDQDALAQNIEDKKIENQEAQAANDAEIVEMERRLLEAQNNYEQANAVDQGAAPNTPSTVDDITPDISDTAAVSSDNNNDWGASSWDDSWGDSNWDSEEELQNSADQQIANSSDNVVTLQTEEASRMYGSVAADEGERNIISSAFASAVSGETPVTPAPDVTQEPTYSQEQRFNQSLGMS